MSGSPIWHPFTQHGLGEPIPEVSHAEGAVLYLQDGSEVIDAISSWWVTTHGHAHPKIAAAIAKQASRLDQIIFAGWTHQPAEQLARSLRALMPNNLTRVFFSDSGSTSVEVALKMALGYWLHRGEVRHRIVVMDRGYHGDTVGTMSVGARGTFNRAYEPLLFDVTAIPFPTVGAEQAALDTLDAACGQGAAAFVVEPLVLGAGGMLMYSAATLAEMRRICAAHGTLFIADEVMTGWGRTGTLLACDQAEIQPDILCLSKGLTGGAIPLAVTMASEPVFEAHLSPDRARMFFHSSSYTANPTACAAANANIAIWQDEPVIERIATLVERQAAHLARLEGHRLVRNPRQSGTITAFEVGEANGYLSDLAPSMLAMFRDRGVLLRPLGNTIYTMPPFCMEPHRLERVYEAIGEVLDMLGDQQ